MIVVKVGEPRNATPGVIWFDPTIRISHRAAPSAMGSILWIPIAPSHPYPLTPNKGDVHVDMNGVPALWDGNSWIPAVPATYQYPPTNPTPGMLWKEPISQTQYVFHAGKWCDVLLVGPSSTVHNVASQPVTQIVQPTQTPGLNYMNPTLTINGPGNTILVQIHNNGTITYGPGYTPDAAAQVFWRALAGSNPRLLQTQIVELTKDLQNVTSRLAIAEGNVLRFTQAGFKLPEPPKPFDPNDSWERAMGIIK